MKLKLTHIFLSAALTSVVFTACKKNSSTNSGTNPQTPRQVSTLIAQNFSSTIFGNPYGVNLSDGLDAPSEMAIHTKGKVLNDLNDPFCGLKVDTTLNYTVTAHDTTATISGSIGYSFFCTDDILSGFSALYNLNVKYTTSQLSATEKLTENLTLTSLNPKDSLSNLSMKGTFGSDVTLAYKTTALGKSGQAAFAYTLSSLVLSSVQDDIISGSATFTTSGTGASGSWNYTGTIVFLGNHMAKITINGSAYTVNLETGAVS